MTNPHEALSGNGSPLNMVFAYGGQTYTDATTGNVWTRPAQANPGTDQWTILSTASFNPSAPGPIGATVPSTGRFTTVNGLIIFGDSNSSVQVDTGSNVTVVDSSGVNLINSEIMFDNSGNASITANGTTVFDAGDGGAAIITKGYTPSAGWVLKYDSGLNAFVPSAP